MADAPAPRRLTIRNKKGLHARASAKMVQLAASFDAEVTVSREGVSVVGTSIMGLLMLAAAPGAVIDVAATGPQAEAALAAIADLVDRLFDEGA